MTFEIREIQPEDNQRIAEIIRQVLTEYGANRPGFAWSDPELDTLSEAYQTDGSVYYVVTSNGAIIGGAGIAPFPCEHPDICELQKMYLLPEFRGKGLGKALMAQALKAAQHYQYRGCYLETFDAMREAVALYKTFGFQSLKHPLGDSGHTSCNQFYLLFFNEQPSTI